MEPRGIRNNNPLNIERNNISWLGLRSMQTDNRFCQFVSMDYGIRAACLIFRTYIQKHRCHTISDVIRRWCPDETATAYIESVCRDCKIPPSYQVDWKNRNSTSMLLQAMGRVECGRTIPMHLFERGWGMAFGKNNPLSE